MKAVCDLYPEFQEIAQPVFAYASSDSVQKILKDGVLSLETAKYSNAKMMEFMTIMVNISFYNVHNNLVQCVEFARSRTRTGTKS